STNVPSRLALSLALACCVLVAARLRPPGPASSAGMVPWLLALGVHGPAWRGRFGGAGWVRLEAGGATWCWGEGDGGGVAGRAAACCASAGVLRSLGRYAERSVPHGSLASGPSRSRCSSSLVHAARSPVASLAIVGSTSVSAAAARKASAW